jgi:hypothetical protein
VNVPTKLFAFILMPFESAFDDIYRLGIQAAANDLGIIATRVDEQVFHKEGILAKHI